MTMMTKLPGKKKSLIKQRQGFLADPFIHPVPQMDRQVETVPFIDSGQGLQASSVKHQIVNILGFVDRDHACPCN